jgi:hypothetical protein
MRYADLFRRESLHQLPARLGDLISSLLVSALHDWERHPPSAPRKQAGAPQRLPPNNAQRRSPWTLDAGLP